MARRMKERFNAELLLGKTKFNRHIHALALEINDLLSAQTDARIEQTQNLIFGNRPIGSD